MTAKKRDEIVRIAKGMAAAAAFVVTAVLTHNEWSLLWGLLAGFGMLVLVWIVPGIVAGGRIWLQELGLAEQDDLEVQRIWGLGE